MSKNIYETLGGVVASIDTIKWFIGISSAITVSAVGGLFAFVAKWLSGIAKQIEAGREAISDHAARLKIIETEINRIRDICDDNHK